VLVKGRLALASRRRVAPGSGVGDEAVDAKYVFLPCGYYFDLADFVGEICERRSVAFARVREAFIFLGRVVRAKCIA
jgi:hypothetical protein